MSKILVTVVMPALNEEKNLRAAILNVLQSFEKLNISGELLVVNDGSSDNTASMAEEIAANNTMITVIHHKTPEGIGGSFWDGVKKSNGEIVVMLPGDGENDALEILRYLPLLDQVDIIVPFVFNREVRSFGRRLLSIVYREIIKASFGLSLNYMNGTVMYRKAVFAGIELQNGGFFYQTELLIKTIRRGHLYAEVPYALSRRGSGDSNATTFKSLVKVARGYISTFIEVHSANNDTKKPAENTVSVLRLRTLEDIRNGE
ncbi:MAG: glycosyltransferase family 2 protein [Desulfuromonadaceae bacterium]|nr:glycosyltransferase family 2 protein [Desulfuromonadaceae bacterium]MDD2854326.1 glycosyltransferase family 2 protein [Desulfuromonadaceae bacterium]